MAIQGHPATRPAGTARDGVVALRKPAGPTSHDLVERARRVLAVERIGHLGTLDPAAKGVLVLAVGRATRLSRYASGWTKSYEGVMTLGRTTSTDDATGEILATSNAWSALEQADVERGLARFMGRYEQRPPIYSAVKVEGERAYRRARRGEHPELRPRAVVVHEIELIGFEAPAVRFRAVVSAGTYLRGLARDLGELLGCGAHLATLCRTAVGPFGLGDTVAVETLNPSDLRDPAVLVGDLPRRDLDPAEREAVIHGRPINLAGTSDGKRETGNVALFSGSDLIAVAELVSGVLKPRVVVSEQ